MLTQAKSMPHNDYDHESDHLKLQRIKLELTEGVSVVNSRFYTSVCHVVTRNVVTRTVKKFISDYSLREASEITFLSYSPTPGRHNRQTPRQIGMDNENADLRCRL